MADPFEEVFSNLRRGPWHEDPNSIPQERGLADGQAESSGWLSDDSVTSDVIRTDAVIARHITSDSIETRHITAAAVTANEIAADSITSAHIVAGTIVASDIAANTITAAQIAASTITSNEIAANTITAADIAAGTITANEIAANTLTANEIAANAITATELAADSVTTNKIVAGNVTSSRIELTISGKNFGANNGSSSQPGVFFDADSTSGLGRLNFGFGTVPTIVSGGFTIAAFAPGALNLAGECAPTTDAAHDLGTTSLRWDVVYRVSESSVSDARDKRDIDDAPLGLDFARSLRPRVFRWRDAVDTQARDAARLDGEAMQRECQPHEDRIAEIRRQQLTGEISEEDGDAEVERLREKLNRIQERHYRPVQEAAQKRRPGKRLHYGLVAQEVKDALDAAGVDSMDAGFWQKDPEGREALSYSELTAVLLKAIQELAAKVENLERNGRS